MRVNRCLLILLWIAFSGHLHSQPLGVKALFLGNSYTYVNNLPALISALAASAGDTLYYDGNTPGGYTLGWQPVAHATDPVSLAKIRQGTWDFIVIQEQSQIPAIEALRDSCMLPAAFILRDSARENDACSQILFYLTWGRRFGGTQCFSPNYCSPGFTDFDQMQDSITRAYKILADSADGWIAPVGEAWRLTLNNSSIVLHDQDYSHPNLNGSYLAACVFYSSMFHKPSTGLDFHAGLFPDTAMILQLAADSIVFGYSTYWNLWSGRPEALFNTHVSGDTLLTQNTSKNSSSWLWDFGDGQTSADFEPVHLYQAAGTYLISLTACDSCHCDVKNREVTVVTTGFHKKEYKSGISLLRPGPDGRIHCRECPGNGTVDLYDLRGRKIHSGAFSGQSFRTGRLSPGMYFFILVSQGNHYHGKLIVDRDY